MERKNLIQDRIIGILGAIQKREGLGRMSVEVEEIASDCTYTHNLILLIIIFFIHFINLFDAKSILINLLRDPIYCF